MTGSIVLFCLLVNYQDLKGDGEKGKIERKHTRRVCKENWWKFNLLELMEKTKNRFYLIFSAHTHLILSWWLQENIKLRKRKWAKWGQSNANNIANANVAYDQEIIIFVFDEYKFVINVRRPLRNILCGNHMWCLKCERWITHASQKM